jgi:hypothetical protein
MKAGARGRCAQAAASMRRVPEGDRDHADYADRRQLLKAQSRTIVQICRV